MTRRRRYVAIGAALLSVAVLLPGSPVTAPVAAQAPTPPPACEHGLLRVKAPTDAAANCVPAETALAAAAASVPVGGFTESIVYSGLTNPTVIQFAADGRVFVAEKSGIVKVFDNLADTTATVFSALPTNVLNYWDRGLLGLTLDPSLTDPTLTPRPWVYVLYTYDHILGDPNAAPRWSDGCPFPPGPTTDGCVASARLSRFTVSGTTISGPEQVLIEDWCQQFPSHTIGTIGFGPDGALYVGAGDGASFNGVDYGQLGGSSGSPTPVNPCADPPGGTLTPPTAEGGALRSQDVRSTSDPAGLDGAILRVDPVTGAGVAGNPYASSTDPNTRRIIAYGLRNPFRFTLRPGTSELWLGDVGWSAWEEVNRVANVSDAVAENFGWPCYEGTGRQSGYDTANLTLCETLYTAGTATAPVYAYGHTASVISGETCPTGSSSIAGLAFYPETGGSFPSAYRGGLFFSDYNRNCIWFMPKGANGQPDPNQRQAFASGVAHPVDLKIGPNGDLFYADFDGGTIRRISPSASGSTSSYASTVGSLSPVAYWRLGESSGTTAADSAGSNTGTYGGAPTLGVAGLLTGDASTAVRFDGTDDQVTVASSAALNQASRLSIAAWINATAWTAGRNPRIVQKGINDTQYRLLVEGGSLLFEIAGVGAASTTPPSVGTRHLVVGTYDGSAVRLYVDNVLAATTAAGGTLPTTSEPLAIANKPTSVDDRDQFAGVIDDVSIHGIALSASQVGQLWTAGTSPPANTPPTALATGNPTGGPAPLTVSFSGAGSSDPDPGDTLTYSWDLNGDGTFGDSAAVAPSYTYATAGTYTAGLRVTDNHGAPSTISSVTITVTSGGGNTAPVPLISTPVVGTTFGVGEEILFSGSASDDEEGSLPAAQLSWRVTIQHCAPDCHPHDIETFSGVDSGSFFGPDHSYPSYLELTLTATDSNGLAASTTRRLDPRTVQLSFETVPSGLQLAVNGEVSPAPFIRTVIEGSLNSVTAGSPQVIGSTTYAFQGWSDNGAATHTIVTGTSATYVATYAAISTTTTLAPTADAEIRSGQPSKNYGNTATLRVRSGTHRSYLKFSIPALSGTVQSARLRVYVTNPGPSAGSAYLVGSGWTETGITWGNAPPITGSPLSTAGAAGLGSWVEFNVTTTIVSGATMSIALSGGGTDAVDYSSRTGSNPPQLVIVTVP